MFERPRARLTACLIAVTSLVGVALPSAGWVTPVSASANIQNQFVLPPIFEENLEGEIDPPAFWTVEDVDDDDLSWQFYRIPFQASDSTKAAIMPNYFYDQVGSRDLLVSPPIDLSQSLNPRLSFDLAYSGFQGTAPDSLLVEISTDCGATVDKTIFAQSGEDLITVADPASFVESFVPSEADWRTEVIDLHVRAFLDSADSMLQGLHRTSGGSPMASTIA